MEDLGPLAHQGERMESLSEDVAALLFAGLEAVELALVARVCRRWRSLSRADALWEPHLAWLPTVGGLLERGERRKRGTSLSGTVSRAEMGELREGEAQREEGLRVRPGSSREGEREELTGWGRGMREGHRGGLPGGAEGEREARRWLEGEENGAINGGEGESAVGGELLANATEQPTRGAPCVSVDSFADGSIPAHMLYASLMLATRRRIKQWCELGPPPVRSQLLQSVPFTPPPASCVSCGHQSANSSHALSPSLCSLLSDLEMRETRLRLVVETSNRQLRRQLSVLEGARRAAADAEAERDRILARAATDAMHAATPRPIWAHPGARRITRPVMMDEVRAASDKARAYQGMVPLSEASVAKAKFQLRAAMGDHRQCVLLCREARSELEAADASFSLHPASGAATAILERRQ